MAEETSAQQAYEQFWPKATEEIRNLEPAGLKHQELPLARIKKVNKKKNYILVSDIQNRIESLIKLYVKT
jgi:hypothetical protein